MLNTRAFFLARIVHVLKIITFQGHIPFLLQRKHSYAYLFATLIFCAYFCVSTMLIKPRLLFLDRR